MFFGRIQRLSAKAAHLVRLVARADEVIE